MGNKDYTRKATATREDVELIVLRIHEVEGRLAESLNTLIWKADLLLGATRELVEWIHELEERIEALENGT